MERYENLQKGEKGAWLSIAAYLCLSALKLSVGYFSESEALKADGLNNFTDIIVSVAVLIGLRVSRKPPDHNHRYGHFRAETIATMVASMIMIAVGIQVTIAAVQSFFKPEIGAPEPIAAWTAVLCGAAMYSVYLYNHRLAKQTKSSALMAAAQDNRADAFVSLGAFLGIIGSQFGLAWLDPLTAVIVGFIILKTGANIFREATHSLSDGFPEKELKVLKSTVKNTPGVTRVSDIRARAHGNFILLDVTILVDKRLSVEESHSITEEIESRMKSIHRIEHVHIHIEPA
ncbi:cation diffusion facilitator family transporter [Paenibacillaceae bacterium WGS1546]|uniref:cation diffusion facilitator family transporter n=1 Tax=Cohnella sp. WGS1546 TaxID=3366810 RepID=UPI00372D76D8